MIPVPDKITTVKEGTVVALPGRDARLPEMYLVESHPLVRADRHPNAIYVCVQDTTPAAMDRYYRFLAEAPFPEGTEAGVSAAGMSRSTIVCWC